MRRPRLAALFAAAGALVAADGAAQDFSFLPPGDLVPDSGAGRADDVVYAPTMLFPMATLPAFANSQVYGHGGYLGPGGGQCDVENYSFPWRDNYCEERSWDMPLCPAGTGHQGQDIRAATCDKDVHPVVAAEDGTITNVGSYSVYLTTADGTRFDYLHMSNVEVSVGQDVSRGDVLGLVSNEFGGTATTIHLHFNIRQNVSGVGTVYVPPYTSLINAYQKLLDRPIDGALEEVSCDAIVGWAFDPDDAEAAVAVPLVFDESGVAHDVLADVYRGDLCENLSFCEHGFDVPPPFSLFDSVSHAVDAMSGVGSLAGAPLAMECEPPALSGGRRPLTDAEYGTWRFSAFWDEPPNAEGAVAAVPVGDAFPSAPELWRIDEALYLVDAAADVLRPIDERAVRAWRLDAAAAEIHTAGEMAIGDAWPSRPLLVRDPSGDAFVIDVASPSFPGGGAGGAPNDETSPPDASTAGCGCRTHGQRDAEASWILIAGLAAAAARRHRRG